MAYFCEVLIRLDLNSHRSLVLSIICDRVLKLDRQVFHLDNCEKTMGIIRFGKNKEIISAAFASFRAYRRNLF